MTSDTYAVFTILFLILLAFLWTAIVAEDRKKRVRYGIVAILAAGLGFFVAGSAISFNYNAWYSSAADKLLEASVKGMEEGRQAEVLREWKAMDKKFRWSYEVKGNFRRLVEEAVEGMGGSEAR